MDVAASAVVAVDGHSVTALPTRMLHRYHLLLVPIPKILRGHIKSGHTTIKQFTWLHLQANTDRRATTWAKGGSKIACVLATFGPICLWFVSRGTICCDSIYRLLDYCSLSPPPNSITQAHNSQYTKNHRMLLLIIYIRAGILIQAQFIH